MDEIKIIEETTESETTPDAPVAEQSVTIDVGTQTVASDALLVYISGYNTDSEIRISGINTELNDEED